MSDNATYRAGIFGPTLCGKTTVAKQLVKEYFKKNRSSSLVLDPHEEQWPQEAVTFSDEEQFWKTVWNGQKQLIVVEEASATLRRERVLIPVFTRMRHLNHSLVVIGHSGVDLLPVMRQQLTTLFLFRQPASAAKIWAELFADDKILECTTLNQYEFLYCRIFHKPQRLRLKL